jgi:CO/xanthine dehydrogenase FAD-binding subunit
MDSFRALYYHKPGSIEEATSTLARLGPRACVVAGATDVIAERRDVEHLVDITALPLDYIREERDGLKIGALTTVESLRRSELLGGSYSVLVEVANHFGHRNLRNLATVGGNLCSSVPSADLAPPLIVMGASARLAAPDGERVIPLGEFFVSVRENILRVGEILVEVQVPRLPLNTGEAFMKIGRTSVDIALVNVAALVTLGDSGECSRVRIVMGSVAPTPFRAKEAEGLLRGRVVGDSLVKEAAEAASREIKPISDQRATADYRREAGRILLERCLREALRRAEV